MQIVVAHRIRDGVGCGRCRRTDIQELRVAVGLQIRDGRRSSATTDSECHEPAPDHCHGCRPRSWRRRPAGEGRGERGEGREGRRMGGGLAPVRALLRLPEEGDRERCPKSPPPVARASRRLGGFVPHLRGRGLLSRGGTWKGRGKNASWPSKWPGWLNRRN
jgi:hypothetical protein